MKFCVPCALRSEKKDFEVDDLLDDENANLCEGEGHLSKSVDVVDPPQLTQEGP